MPIPRLHLFELADQSWFPSAICDLITDSLDFVETRFALHEPEDARTGPPELRELRTMFNSSHHFRPREAMAVLRDAAQAGRAIGIFEIPDHNLRMIVPTFFWCLYSWQLQPHSYHRSRHFRSAVYSQPSAFPPMDGCSRLGIMSRRAFRFSVHRRSWRFRLPVRAAEMQSS
jgi:hypothetical protein